MKHFLLILALFLVGCSYETINNYQEPTIDGMGGAGSDDMSGGWATSGTLATMNRRKGVQLQADFPVLDTYTVQFNIMAPDVTIRPQASITWSVNGNQVTRIVDVFEGTSVSGQAESVTVVLYDAGQDNTAQTGPVGTEYTGTIQITRGKRGGSLVPTLTAVTYTIESTGNTITNDGVFIVPAAETAIVQIPRGTGAQSFLVSVRSVTIGTIIPPEDVRITVGNPGGFSSASYQPTIGTNLSWLPLASGARQIEIQNNSPDQIHVSVAFGIDG